MSVLDRILGTSKKALNWKELTSLDALDAADKESHNRPVVLFKHSIRCGTSAFAKERLESLPINDTFDFYYLDLITYRGVSDEIARRYKVIHQSPQIIILKKGVATFNTSHHSISPEGILAQLN